MLGAERRGAVVAALHSTRPPGDPVILARSFCVTLISARLPDHSWAHVDGVGLYDSRGVELAPWYALAACLLFGTITTGEFSGGDVAMCAIEMTLPEHMLRDTIDAVCSRQPYAPRWLHVLRKAALGTGSGQIRRVG